MAILRRYVDEDVCSKLYPSDAAAITPLRVNMVLMEGRLREGYGINGTRLQRQMTVIESGLRGGNNVCGVGYEGEISDKKKRYIYSGLQSSVRSMMSLQKRCPEVPETVGTHHNMLESDAHRIIWDYASHKRNHCLITPKYPFAKMHERTV